MSALYQRLMGSGPAAGAEAAPDPFDRHLFACALALAAGEARPLTVGLGLAPTALAALLRRHFPAAAWLADGIAADGSEALALEEPDLRALLVEHGSRGAPEEEWLAHIVARRSLEANHLWQDLGLSGRADLSGLMTRHFTALAAKNRGDMKWKKFFYRELCQREGIPICKAPTCDVCPDMAICFGGEEGEALVAVSQIRQMSVSL